MRHTGPKNRLSRRQGADLELKTYGSKSHATLMRKVAVPPGQHGANSRRKLSEHGKQLKEKQKLRFMFGLTERQLSNYFTVAKKTKGNTGKILCSLIESRLDNALYRSGFAPTRAMARQLVTHGHIRVDGKDLNIPSYLVKPNNMISFKNESTTQIPAVSASVGRKDFESPSWIKRDGLTAKVLATPTPDTLEKQVNLRLIVEFYSK